MSIFYLSFIILEPDTKYVGTTNVYSNRGILLPWGAHKERLPFTTTGHTIDMDVKPGEYVMQSLFADFTIQAEKKIEEAVMYEPQVCNILPSVFARVVNYTY